MAAPNDAQRERAKRVLAYEAHSIDAAAPTAAARVYDKLHAHLQPLVGTAGVELLLVRSARLAGGELEGLASAAMLHGAAALRARLATPKPEIGAESAISLFATFLNLISTFVGERLTLQLLRRAWPALDDSSTRGEAQ